MNLCTPWPPRCKKWGIWPPQLLWGRSLSSCDKLRNSENKRVKQCWTRSSRLMSWQMNGNWHVAWQETCRGLAEYSGFYIWLFCWSSPTYGLPCCRNPCSGELLSCHWQTHLDPSQSSLPLTDHHACSSVARLQSSSYFLPYCVVLHFDTLNFVKRLIVLSLSILSKIQVAATSCQILRLKCN